MKFIVTGGAGFIGSNLAEELAGKGKVIIVDNLSTGKIKNIRNLIDNDDMDVELVKRSVTNINALKEIFKDADCVFHLAAIPSVQLSVENPLDTNEVNIKGTLNVLIAARESGVKKVVFTSSCSVYGDTSELSLSEDMKPDPLSPYAVSKLAGEYYCNVFLEVYGLKTVCLRYFNVYGPKQDPASEYAAVIPKFITRVLNKKPPIVFGDGNQTRDFIFVKDVAKANVMAMEQNVKGVYNIGSGQSVSINELAYKIIENSGVKLKPIYDKPMPGEVRHSLSDISLARDKLGFEPDFNLDEGLGQTIEWFREK